MLNTRIIPFTFESVQVVEIGRASQRPSCTRTESEESLFFEERTISKHHAKIIIYYKNEATQVLLIDTHSQHGTVFSDSFVSTTRPVELYDGCYFGLVSTNGVVDGGKLLKSCKVIFKVSINDSNIEVIKVPFSEVKESVKPQGFISDDCFEIIEKGPNYENINVIIAGSDSELDQDSDKATENEESFEQDDENDLSDGHDFEQEEDIHKFEEENVDHFAEDFEEEMYEQEEDYIYDDDYDEDQVEDQNEVDHEVDEEDDEEEEEEEFEGEEELEEEEDELEEENQTEIKDQDPQEEKGQAKQQDFVSLYAVSSIEVPSKYEEAAITSQSKKRTFETIAEDFEDFDKVNVYDQQQKKAKSETKSNIKPIIISGLVGALCGASITFGSLVSLGKSLAH